MHGRKPGGLWLASFAAPLPQPQRRYLSREPRSRLPWRETPASRGERSSISIRTGSLQAALCCFAAGICPKPPSKALPGTRLLLAPIHYGTNCTRLESPAKQAKLHEHRGGREMALQRTEPGVQLLEGFLNKKWDPLVSLSLGKSC